MKDYDNSCHILVQDSVGNCWNLYKYGYYYFNYLIFERNKIKMFDLILIYHFQTAKMFYLYINKIAVKLIKLLHTVLFKKL